MSSEIYAVAMSGGVDSSVSAAIIQKSGKDLFGITMDIHSDSERSIEDASKICKKLGIEHFVFDAKEEFKSNVINVFVNYYSRGLTPNPCAFCNRDIKLNLLLNFAKSNGADLMATGHYVNMKVTDSNVFMKESKNIKKDQSYFLSLVSRDSLKNTRFPIGNIENKDETRKMAFEFGLSNFEKKESQDICFIPDGDYKTFIKNFQNNMNLFSYGKIKDCKRGDILGEHRGIVNYTIGQRKGLGISSDSPLYVVKLDNVNNEVIVGSRDNLDINEFFSVSMNWIIDTNEEFEAFVKLRSSCKKILAKITKINNEVSKVRLREVSQTPVTNGQICAIYDCENQVIGAGIISI